MGLLDILSGASKASKGVKEAKQMIEQGSKFNKPFAQQGADIFGQVHSMLMGDTSIGDTSHFQDLMTQGEKFMSQRLNAQGKSRSTSAYTTGLSQVLMNARNEVMAPYMQAAGLGQGAAGQLGNLYGSGASTVMEGRIAQGQMIGAFSKAVMEAGAKGAGMGMCWLAASIYGPLTREHVILANHINTSNTWLAWFTRGVYTILKPLFNALLKEATNG